jgi:hypothetical protein
MPEKVLHSGAPDLPYIAGSFLNHEDDYKGHDARYIYLLRLPAAFLGKVRVSGAGEVSDASEVSRGFEVTETTEVVQWSPVSPWLIFVLYPAYPPPFS